MKKISILGSTGSIGTQTLEVIKNHSDEFQVLALSCGHNIELFRKQLKEFRPKFAVCANEEDAKVLSKEYPGIDFAYGMDGLCQLSSLEECDMVVNSLLGMMGLRPTFAAINAKKNIAFANKETLVAGGSFLTDAVRANGIDLLPVDSEHSAIFQSLQGYQGGGINKILLTASGGPFRGYTQEQLLNVSKEQALKHPNWNMGAKITIDSASMMNKGLEIIEASLLFGIDPSKIEVYVHPESILHSAVEFADGAIVGQMGLPDMKVPIAYALSWPKRLSNVANSVNLFELGALHFEKPDLEVFKCLALAYKAIKAGHSYQIVMNAANEEAVQGFLKDKITFTQIADVIEDTMNASKAETINSVDDIFELEKQSRALALEFINHRG